MGRPPEGRHLVNGDCFPQRKCRLAWESVALLLTHCEALQRAKSALPAAAPLVTEQGCLLLCLRLCAQFTVRAGFLEPFNAMQDMSVMYGGAAWAWAQRVHHGASLRRSRRLAEFHQLHLETHDAACYVLGVHTVCIRSLPSPPPPACTACSEPTLRREDTRRRAERQIWEWRWRRRPLRRGRNAAP